MLKKILIGALSTLVVAAVGVSAYNTTIKPSLAQSETAAMAAPEVNDAAADAVVAAQAGLAGNFQAQQQARGEANGPGSPAASGEPLSAGARGGYAAASLVPASGQAQPVSGGQGRGNRFGARGNAAGTGQQAQFGSAGGSAAGSADGSAIPSPQNGLTEWISLEGTASQVAYPTFTLTTSDGQSILVSLGNLNYAASLGIDLSDGEAISLTGFWDVDGTLAVGSLQVDGQTYILRDDFGRPLWSGGANH